jgi:SynChlorMet cassette protein ScmC
MAHPPALALARGRPAPQRELCTFCRTQRPRLDVTTAASDQSRLPIVASFALADGARCTFRACGDDATAAVEALGAAMRLPDHRNLESPDCIDLTLDDDGCFRTQVLDDQPYKVAWHAAALAEHMDSEHGAGVLLLHMATVLASALEASRPALLLHAAAVEHAGAALLLAGHAGSGKTTAALSVPPPWRTLCDDAALVVRGPKGDWFVHPWPTWSRYIHLSGDGSWPAEPGVPLAGIYLLRPGLPLALRPIGTGEATLRLIQGAEQLTPRALEPCPGTGPQDRLHRFRTVAELVHAVPVRELRLKARDPFWQVLETSPTLSAAAHAR